MPVFGRTAFTFKLFAGSSLSGYPDFEDLYENYDRSSPGNGTIAPNYAPFG